MPKDKPNFINPDLGNIEEDQQFSTHYSDKLNDQEDNPMTGIEAGGEDEKVATKPGGNRISEQVVNPELGELEEAQQNDSLNEGEGSILLTGFDEHD